MSDILFAITMAVNLSWATAILVFTKGTGVRSTSAFIAFAAAIEGAAWYYMTEGNLRSALAPLWAAIFGAAVIWFVRNNRQAIRERTVHSFRNPLRARVREVAGSPGLKE